MRESMTMDTCVEEEKIQLNRPVIIEGLPGLGSVGAIVASYLIEQSKAKMIAVLRSPHFPYYALVDKRGVARLPRNEFYYYKDKDNEKDVIVITGDCQPQTAIGQYEVAERIVDYAFKHSARLIVTVGGYSSHETSQPKVVGAATSNRICSELTKLGVVINRMGIPVVGVAGLVLPLAELRGLDGVCLLGETVGYAPDPRAAKSVLNVLTRLLHIEVGYADLDREIEKMHRLDDRIRQATHMLDEEIAEKKLDERFSYIS
jgi:hypothetical protein